MYILHLVWGLQRGSLLIPQNLNGSAFKSENMRGVMVRTHRKRGGIAQGFCLSVPKCVFFSPQRKVAFVLFLYRFRPFLKYKAWIGSRMRTPLRISAQEVSRPPLQKKGNFEEYLSACYSSNGTISGDGKHLVDIPRMCLSFQWVSLGGTLVCDFGAVIPRKPIKMGNHCCRLCFV